MGSRMLFLCSAQKSFHFCCRSPDVNVLKKATKASGVGRPANATARCGDRSGRV